MTQLNRWSRLQEKAPCASVSPLLAGRAIFRLGAGAVWLATTAMATTPVPPVPLPPVPVSAVAAVAAPETISPILWDLRRFRELGSVMYIAAHPDDENTPLITYLSRGRGYRTAYLSLTRGDGGQNMLGPELGSELGVARTQELLAGRRNDDARQYFTRALDFGFSKTADETLALWNRPQVVADIVRMIREFRPDVVITRFSPMPSGTHGHHTASAILALEAFKLAGVPHAFPEQLTGGLTPWQPRRILQNGTGAARGPNAAPALPPGTVQFAVNGTDPVLGETFADIARRSLFMHKTQGFVNPTGGSGRNPPRLETFVLLDGEPAQQDILDGVDSTWARFPDGSQIDTLLTDTITQFKPDNPSASLPALLTLRQRVAALPANPVIDDKRQQLDRIVQSCLGLVVETSTPDAEIVPGEKLRLRHSVSVRRDGLVRWLAVRYPATKTEFKVDVSLAVGEPATRDGSPVLPTSTLPSQPYWLREVGTAGMARVDDPFLIGRPDNPTAFPVEYIFEIGGQTLVLTDEPLPFTNGSAKGALRRRLDVIPPVSVSFIDEVELFSPGGTQSVEVEITAARPGANGTLQLEAPADWKVSPAATQFALKRAGEKARLKFTLTAPPHPAKAVVGAVADVGGIRCRTGRKEIQYDHIPMQLLQPTARLKAVSLEMATRGKKIGYLPGAGDETGLALTDMGYAVTDLTGADLTAEKLKEFDAVVIGVRAFNVRTDLVAQLPSLFAYVEGGGTVVAQYNRPGRDPSTEQLAPFSLRLSGDRVTDEQAAMVFLAPDHPALNTPNKITTADFEGWVQERGLYFPNQWDERFTPILACHDTGEAPMKGVLLIARHGQGHFVYTGLSFFRQLPDGVPGAYRLFANLVSLGK